MVVEVRGQPHKHGLNFRYDIYSNCLSFGYYRRQMQGYVQCARTLVEHVYNHILLPLACRVTSQT